MVSTETLDLYHPAVQHICKHDKRLEKVVKMVGPIQYSLHTDSSYSFLIHEIIEQMLSVKAGQKIYARFEELCCGEVKPDRVSQLSIDEIREAGMSKSKVRSILALTSAIVDNVAHIDVVKQGFVFFDCITKFFAYSQICKNKVACSYTRLQKSAIK